jgi:hypothetical protein
MARIRSIKPEFWTSEQVVECSPTARLLFVGMWTFADDGGVLPDSWKRIKMQVFPGDEFGKDHIERMVAELFQAGLIDRFYHENQAFLLIKGWHHQKIDKPSYKYPQPKEGTKFDDRSTNGRQPFDDSSPPDGIGEDRRGEDRSGSTLSVSETENGRCEYSPDFEQFWAVYPKQRRTKKQEAFRRWKHALKRVDAGLLIQRANDYANSEQGRSEYAVMPGVWLNGGMWQDEPEAWGRGKNQVLEVPF